MDERVAVNEEARGPDTTGRAGLLILVAVGLVLFFWRLGSHDLWPPDEPRFALVAQEMRERSDYVVLSLNNHLYTDKPPLFFWAINGFGRLLGGIDEWAARLPSAVATLAAMLLIARLGAWLYDRRTGIIAALVFATSLQIVARGRWASIDMTLNLFVLAAILLLWRGRVKPQGSAASIRLAWVMMGLATLAKGPVGLILPLLAVVPSCLIERDFRAARRIFLPSGLALFVLVTLSWFGPFAMRLGPREAIEVLMHQNVERYVSAWNATHPVWFYLWRFPSGFFPWIVFLPWGVAQAFAADEKDRRGAALFLVTWIAAILLFFSFSTGKRGVYIIPLYPAAAILVARLLARGSEHATPAAAPEAASRRLRTPLLISASIAAVLAVAIPIATRRQYAEMVPLAAGIGILLAAGGIAAAVLHARSRGIPAVATLMGSLVLVVLISTERALPLVNRHENIRGFAEQVRASLLPGAPFATTEEKRDAWVFYTGRFAEETDTPEAIADYLARDGPRDLLIEDDLLRRIDLARLPGVVEVLRGTVAGHSFHLLRKEGAR
jgi:4-amino-4-deoxy-L-arabinose transferase-like glycosyltransferase